MPNYCTVTLQDEMKRQTRVKIEVTGLDANAVLANAILAVDNLVECTKLGFVRAKLQVPVAANPQSAAVGSNTDVGGKVRGLSDEDDQTVLLRIPDPIAGIVDATSGRFDLTQANLAAYLARFETGGICELSDGEQVDSWTYGELDAR